MFRACSLPAKTASTLHAASDGTCKKTAKCATENSRRHVYTEALRLLIFLVPGRDNEEDTRSETGFENTNEDSECDKVLEIVDDGHAACQGSPNNHDGG